MNKKILSMILTGSIIIGSIGMAYADDEIKKDIYKDNKELQEIFKVYDNDDKNSDMLLAPNPMIEKNAELKVLKGGSIELKLEENITTGCTWHVEIENEDILKVDKDEYKNIYESDYEEGKKTICGSPGVHTWKFKALNEGVTKLTFKLYQDWDASNVYETKEYLVTIGQDGEKQIHVNPYEDNKELQEIFKIYESADKNSDILLVPNTMPKEKEEINIEKIKSNLLQKLIEFILNI